MNAEQVKSLADSKKFYQKARALEEEAGKARTPERRADLLKQARYYSDNAKNMEELAYDRGF